MTTNEKHVEDILRELAKINNELMVAQRELAKKNAELERKNNELEQAMAEIKRLQSLIPICMHCKKIKNSDGYWLEVDEYLYNHTDSMVSHGLCLSCKEEHYSELINSNS